MLNNESGLWYILFDKELKRNLLYPFWFYFSHENDFISKTTIETYYNMHALIMS